MDKPGRIIDVMAMSGGVGHTTLVLDLAIELGSKGPVAILDADPPIFREWSRWGNIFSETWTYPLASASKPSGGVVLIRGEGETLEAGPVSSLRNLFSFVLVHAQICAHSSLGWLAGISDAIIIPVMDDLASLLKVKDGLALVDSWLFPRAHVFGVFNRMGRSSHLDMKEMSSTLGIEVLESLQEEAFLHERARREGRPPMLFSPDSPYADGIRRLSRRMESDSSLYRSHGTGVCGVDSTPSVGLDGLVEHVRGKLIANLDERRREAPEGAAPADRSAVAAFLEHLMAEDLTLSSARLSLDERRDVFKKVLDRVVGLGPLEDLLADETVSEIMVRGDHAIWVEREGKLELTSARFKDLEDVSCAIERIISPLGRRVDESVPVCDARLPDGSRVNIIIPPIALEGPEITIRKFRKNHFTPEDLIRAGVLSPDMMRFLERCVRQHQSILVSGGTGSGKTTLLNIFSSFIDPGERIVTIEDSAELRLQQNHVVRLEARPPNLEGAGAVTIRQLLINALRMRPDRIIIGECRGPEAFDLLQALNTGHRGSLTTLHANSPREALSRLEVLTLMAGVELPLKSVREQILGGVDIIVQVSRFAGGSRKVVSIAELVGMEGDVITLSELYTHRPDASRDGHFETSGLMPHFLQEAR